MGLILISCYFVIGIQPSLILESVLSFCHIINIIQLVNYIIYVIKL